MFIPTAPDGTTNYRGHKITSEVEYDDDRSTTYTDVVTPAGDKVSADISDFGASVTKWIEAGMPVRSDFGVTSPLRDATLDGIIEARDLAYYGTHAMMKSAIGDGFGLLRFLDEAAASDGKLAIKSWDSRSRIKAKLITLFRIADSEVWGSVPAMDRDLLFNSADVWDVVGTHELSAEPSKRLPLAPMGEPDFRWRR